MKRCIKWQWIWLLLLMLKTSWTRAQVVINEYSCSNVSTTLDVFNEREDWVELLNTGAVPVNLSGYYMSDDKNVPQKWQVPPGATIPANGRMMVFCSDRGVFTGGQLHPSFKLTQMKGEYFVLANNAGAIVDSVHFIPTQADHSRGRITDGNTQWGLFNIPTPNAPNANAKTTYATKPVFNIQPGNYTTTQNITINSPDPNVQIHYTLDGSVPTIASPVYAAPIPVSATTVIRAVAFSSDPMILPSFTETNTYLINETTTMNVISVCGSYNTLFNSWGGNGISTSFEYFDKNKQFRFEFEGISRQHGHDSWAYPQKGFRVYTKDQYGYDYAMKYKLFNTSPRDTFKQIILKAAASDNYPGNAGHPSCHLRDAFVHTLSIKYNIDVDERNYEPTIIYINGQYWGIYEIREKVNTDYMEYYYGQTEKKVDHLSYWGGLEVRSGSDTGWNNLYNYIMANNMAVQSNYDHVKHFLDVKSLITYFILNTWLVDTDWLNWNTMWWRGRKGAGVKWRYALWDEDNVLDLGQNYTGMGTTGYQNDPCQPFDLFQNNSSIKHTDMLVRLMNNPEFEQLYRATFIDMLNGPLNCDHLLPHFDSIVNIIQPEMQRHCNRWGGSYATWQGNVQHMRDQIVGRCAVIAQKLDSCMDLNPQKLSINVSPANAGTVQMDGNTVSPYVWSRIMEADTVLNLAAIPASQYYFFDHWEQYEVTNALAPDPLSTPVAFTFNKKDSVVAFFRYFNPDSVNITFDVTPAGKGSILLNNTALPGYPYTVKLDRRNTYTLAGLPVADYRFYNWTKQKANTSFTPGALKDAVSFNFMEADTIIAHFQYDPAPTPPVNPTIPELDQQLVIPTAFSPNGDGRNDVFHIIKGNDVKSVDLRVFDRFGNLVFHTIDAKGAWDGTYKGKPCEMGTYYYSLTVWFDNDYQNSNKLYKGEVTLVR